jgi:hypothetical protein
MKLKAPIKISELKQIAQEKDLQAIVAIAVARDGMMSIVTYGETKEKCKIIGDWGQGLWDWAISKEPFVTKFGWGNNGKPLLSIEELAEHNSKVKYD